MPPPSPLLLPPREVSTSKPRFLGTAELIYSQTGASIRAPDRVPAVVREALGDDAYSAAHAAGQVMDLDQAIDDAMAEGALA